MHRVQANISGPRPSNIMEFPLTTSLYVEGFLSGRRVDAFVSRHLRNYTRDRIQRLIRAGQVRVDGMVAPLEQRVFDGQEVEVRLIEPPDKLLAPEPIPLAVVYDDPWIMAVNKPVGMVTHPVGEFQSGTLANAVQTYLDRQSRVRGLLRPGIVHRLDRQTSGVIAVTKNHVGHRALAKQFQRGQVLKEYVAVLEGRLPQEEYTIRLPIGTYPGGGTILMSCRPDAVHRRKAETSLRVIQRGDRRTLVVAKPKTGRLHQIRVHCATLGYPVVGDAFYGPGGTLRRKSPAPTAKPHALHASRLIIYHPVNGRRVAFTALPSGDLWGEFLGTLSSHFGQVAQTVS